MAIHPHLRRLGAAVLILQQIYIPTTGQQPYLDNKQLDCNDNNFTFTQGNFCNSSSSSSCLSYLTFRTTALYNSPVTVGYLLNSSPSLIAGLNRLPSDVSSLPSDTLLLIPVNCSCTSLTLSTSPPNAYYQHTASYVLKAEGETYFAVANNTYQGLSTCQALISQNPYNFLNLSVGATISVPLRCACPSLNQTRFGFKYLLSYLVTWGDSVQSIADMFGADNRGILVANELDEDSIIFPFTPIIVPLKSEPVLVNPFLSPSPLPSPPHQPAAPADSRSGNGKKFVFIGVGIGGFLLAFIALLGFVFCFLRRGHKQEAVRILDKNPNSPSGNTGKIIPDSTPWSIFSETVRFAVGSLTLYKFEELQKATGFFDESNRIKGCVYGCSFNGDKAAVKVIRGDVSEEISVMKQINHSNIIRLSGFCVHDGNTYLVYEFADNGSLDDWLHMFRKKAHLDSGSFRVLGWKERVQIAYNVADALNYLHNYTNPPYVHKNLKSSNILLACDFSAKLSNFGLARSLRANEDLQMTRHVVGTRGYMAPEYVESGLVTPKLDVYSFGVVLLEILSGKEAVNGGQDGGDGMSRETNEEQEREFLSTTIREILEGENVREKLSRFMDAGLGQEYPLDLAYAMAHLAKNCVAYDPNSRPHMAEVLMTMSKIMSSSMDWDPSEELDSHSWSLNGCR